jgi:hypothetical protein
VSEKTRKWFPILGTPFAINRSMLNEDQAKRNHYQSLDRLEERGGLGITEITANIGGRKWRAQDNKEAADAIIAASEEHAEVQLDSKRLQWMQFHGAKVCWGSDDEVCTVRWADRDGEYQTELFHAWKAAIDAAMAGQVKVKA